MVGTVLLKNREDRVKKGAPEKRKREKADDFLDEDVRKKPKAEEINVSSTEANSGAELTDDGENLERSPRDALHSPKSPSTSLAARQYTFSRGASLPSPPLIHPDRQHHFTHPSLSSDSRVLPLSPLSRSPEHKSDGQVAEDVRLAAKLQRSAAETLGEYRTSSEDTSRPKPPRIDTARAMSRLDPRSPAYEQNTRDMAPHVGTEKRHGHRQGSRDQIQGADRYQPSSNPPSRRQSETMPPPTSARPPRSKSSTPNTSTPVTEKDPSLVPVGVSSKTAKSKDSILKTSTSVDKGLSLPQNLTKQDHAPPLYNFSGFAQSIMSAASVNMRLENVEEEAARIKRESLRQQRHGNTYETLDDIINAKYGALEKSEDRLLKQLQGHNSNQVLIASKLDAHVIQAPPSSGKTPSISNIPEVSEELAKLREEVDYLTRKCLRQSDLDRYSKKAVSWDDLSRFIERDDLVGGEKIVAEHTLEIKKLRDNVSDLSSVTGDRHREVQEARGHHATRFEGVETNLDAALTKLAGLEKGLESRKEDSTSLGVRLRELQDLLNNLNAFIRGDTDDDESSLDRIVQNDTGKINQIADVVSQLKGRIENVEEAVAKGSEPLHQPLPPAKNDSVQSGGIETLRQDMEIFEKAKNEEYEFVVDQICKLEGSIDGLKADSHKQSQLLDSRPTPPVPPQASASASAQNQQVKIEKLETDLRAFGTHFYAQQKKFDTLTTEDLAQSIIHQMKQLYPEHPGFVQDKLKAVEFTMNHIDLYLRNNLHPKLVGMDSAILARAGSDLFQQLCTRVQILEAATQDAYVHTHSTREDLSKSIDVLKQDVITNRIDASTGQNEIATKLGNIEGELGVLSREKSYPGAVKFPNKQTKVALIEKSVEPDGTTEFHTPVASKSSSRQDSAASAPSGVLLSDEEESDAPISHRRERKRKLVSSISDSEDDYDSTRRLRTSSQKK